MIRIHRTPTAPAKLRQTGSRQTEIDCAAYDAAPAGYIAHTESFPTKNYYKWKDVKNVLMKMHREKCCYCETKLYGAAHLHVEHFRPKAEVRQSRAGNREYPGYYWLAYCWENLLLACPICNMNKGTLFPLENPVQRVRSHSEDLARELNLFVNPSEEDPREHIRFQGDLPVPQSDRGRCTIEGLCLRRPELREGRLEWLNTITTLLDSLEIAVGSPPSPSGQAWQDDVRRLIEKSVQPDAKFSSMVMDLVEHRGVLVGNIEQAGN